MRDWAPGPRDPTLSGKSVRTGRTAGHPAGVAELLGGEDPPHLVTGGAVSVGGRVPGMSGREAFRIRVN